MDVSSGRGKNILHEYLCLESSCGGFSKLQLHDVLITHAPHLLDMAPAIFIYSELLKKGSAERDLGGMATQNSRIAGCVLT